MKIAVSQSVKDALRPGCPAHSTDFVQAVENPSLILQRYCAIWKEGRKEDKELEQTARASYLDAAVRRSQPALAFSSRKSWLQQLAADPQAELVVARLGARLIVNQAASVLENAGLALDRNFGIPYIPGSAVKGVTRSWAVEAAKRGDVAWPEVFAVFGWGQADHDQQLLRQAQIPAWVREESFAGLVAFLPAFPLQAAPLALDIVNCHHRDYYSGKLDQALDVELPVPNVFPSVEAGAEFFFVVRPASTVERCKTVREWLSIAEDFNPVKTARSWLVQALQDQGFGAKTAAGYGWFEVDEAAGDQFAEEIRSGFRAAREAEERKRAEGERLSRMSPVERAREEIRRLDQEAFAHLARSLGEKDETTQRAFILELVESRLDRWKSWKKRKPDLASELEAVATKLGEKLP
ncbi:MAG TPA: type III-B CRISPR module RAMP protein Cmr6 [Acidobacteriota bacterium]|nr:type III-B CRISPR module RAMP protein Cmr6 [Acidobacteriota bacterium]HRR25120.1 type III-B CRISPR module RAMP protein Cmr6 [Acidobacteriota bacterium]HRR56226.1 type III-B CRISPR module RAMP protein Cmr6 [Acidobacteriota bacterium]